MLCETADDVQGIDEGAVGDEDSHAVQIVIVEVTVALETVLYVDVTVAKSEVIVAVTVLVVSVSYVTTVVVESLSTEVTVGSGVGVVSWDTEDIVGLETGVESLSTEVTIGSRAGVVSEGEAVGLLLVCWATGTPTVEVTVIVESVL